MLILTADDIAQALTMPQAIAAMRSAFRQISSGAAPDVATVPPRVATPTPAGVTLSMPAYLPEQGALVVKVVSVHPGNAARGLATIQGAVLLLDAHTGELKALLDGRSLTALRTGAATGLATGLLARPEAAVLTIFGAGGQSAQQIAGVQAVRAIREVRVVRRGDPAAVALVGADIVVTATNSATPLFAFEDLPAGVHINAIGSYRPDIRELDAETMRRATVIVDATESARAEAGELQGGVTIHAELGQIVAGLHPGRTRSDEVTVFKSVGHAAQDAAIAHAIVPIEFLKGKMGRRSARPGSDLRLRITRAEPLYEGIRYGHGGESALAHQRKVSEQGAGLHVGQRGGRVQLGGKFEVDDRELGILRVRPRFGGDFGQADDGRFAGAVIDKHLVAGAHGADGLKRLWVANAVPSGAFVAR